MEQDVVVLSHLFRNRLFVFDEEKELVDFTGLSGKQIDSPRLLFILNNPGEVTISENDADLLSKMTGYIGIEKSKAAAINIADLPVSFLQLKERNILAIIAFGIHPSRIGLQTEQPLNEVIHFRNVEILFTDSLSALAALPRNHPFKNRFFDVAKSMLRP